MQERAIICHSCGKESEQMMGQPPCEKLVGWLTVSDWKGKDAVAHYCFCSFACLHRWVRENIVQIPDVFLTSFDEDN